MQIKANRCKVVEDGDILCNRGSEGDFVDFSVHSKVMFCRYDLRFDATRRGIVSFRDSEDVMTFCSKGTYNLSDKCLVDKDAVVLSEVARLSPNIYVTSTGYLGYEYKGEGKSYTLRWHFDPFTLNSYVIDTKTYFMEVYINRTSRIYFDVDNDPFTYIDIAVGNISYYKSLNEVSEREYIQTWGRDKLKTYLRLLA